MKQEKKGNNNQVQTTSRSTHIEIYILFGKIKEGNGLQPYMVVMKPENKGYNNLLQKNLKNTKD